MNEKKEKKQNLLGFIRENDFDLSEELKTLDKLLNPRKQKIIEGEKIC